MSGCQEALLLTRQPTPAVPLQQVSLGLHSLAPPLSSGHLLLALLDTDTTVV